MQVSVLRATYANSPLINSTESPCAAKAPAIFAGNAANFSQPFKGPQVTPRQNPSLGIMSALLDDQQGPFVPVQHGANGLPQVALTAPAGNGANRPSVHGELGMGTGELTTADLDSQTAASLASEVINTLGSNGSLSIADVERALTPSTADNQQWLADTRELVSSDWNQLAGGSQTLTQSQLSAAIQSYQPQIYAEALSLQQTYA